MGGPFLTVSNTPDLPLQTTDKVRFLLHTIKKKPGCCLLRDNNSRLKERSLITKPSRFQ